MPSETVLLGLKKLFLNANPLTPPPNDDDFTSARLLGPLSVFYDGPPPLREFALRVLLSRPVPSTDGNALPTPRSAQPKDTVLEAMYELPLPSNTLSADLEVKLNASLRPLARSRSKAQSITPASSFHQLDRRSASLPQLLPSAILPSSLAPLEKETVKTEDIRLNNAYYDAKFNRCPNIAEGCGKTIFVDHAEERLEWIPDLAEEVVSDLKGGLVPVLWRGCLRGCLDFLEPKPVASDNPLPSEMLPMPAIRLTASMDWDDEFELDPC